ncbi:response regulator [Paenibacillus zeisoli]|uniref:Response regulator n=1 Tax=Paenibacillus zeisoli TaxID=2496267 RepID=A0A433XN66_9BACL|nr:response regulator [Paenibacillus zeisoli]RUT35552.1 response regulator [Paenibacillus zeisoli]
MYTVLIVDDEEPVREAIRILGEWKTLGVSQIYEAADGKEALAMFEKCKPQLVMVDMKMPEMNGAEFLQVVEQIYPQLLTIVISGYNDFQFTRQAIRSKVVDYLLKPVNRQDLNQALRKAIGVIEAKRISENEQITRNITLNMSLPRLKENIYLSILERSYKEQSSEGLLPLIEADGLKSCYLTAVVRIMNQNAVCSRRFNGEAALLQYAVSNVLGDVSDSNLQAFSFANPKRPREMVVVYTSTKGYLEDSSFKAGLLVKRALTTLGRLFDIQVVAGIGSPYKELSELADSYDEAKAALQATDLLRLSGSVISTGTLESRGSRESLGLSLGSRVALLRSTLEAGNMGQARSLLDDYLSTVKSLGKFTLGEADWMLHDFRILLSDLAIDFGVPVNAHQASGLFRILDTAQTGHDFLNFEQFHSVMGELLKIYGEQIRQRVAGSRSFHIEDVKEYIDRYYYEDIKISMFTEKYYLSREYLMKLFKQQYGFGIHEYMQSVRMEKAADLLNDPQLKVQEISEILGYKDKNYFSKAFRNYYHLSPSEYRARSANADRG